jgi:transposase
MTRKHYGPAERARALALAAEVGPSEAAQRLGIRVGTVTGWAAKAKRAPESFAADVAAGEALLASEDESNLDTLRARERRVGHALDRALEQGKTNDVRNLSVAIGILQDKITVAARSEVQRGPSAITADRLAAEFERYIADSRSHAVRRWARASRGQLQAEYRRLTLEIARLTAQRRMIAAEMVRSEGTPSAFDGATADVSTWPECFRPLPEIEPEPEPVRAATPQTPHNAVEHSETALPQGTGSPPRHLEDAQKSAAPTHPRLRVRRQRSFVAQMIAAQGFDPKLHKPKGA